MRGSCPSKNEEAVEPTGSSTFATIADVIAYRWTVERDTWVAPSEVARARAYLREAGVDTEALPDGRFLVHDERGAVCEGARAVLLGLKRLHAARRAQQPDQATPARPARTTGSATGK
jgi:hypothetical protein